MKWEILRLLPLAGVMCLTGSLPLWKYPLLAICLVLFSELSAKINTLREEQDE